jgi:hypothetical protein
LTLRRRVRQGRPRPVVGQLQQSRPEEGHRVGVPSALGRLALRMVFELGDDFVLDQAGVAGRAELLGVFLQLGHGAVVLEARLPAMLTLVLARRNGIGDARSLLLPSSTVGWNSPSRGGEAGLLGEVGVELDRRVALTPSHLGIFRDQPPQTEVSGLLGRCATVVRLPSDDVADAAQRRSKG